MAEQSTNNLWQNVKKRLDKLVSIRAPYEPDWKDIIDLVRPELSAWDDFGDSNQGKARNLNSYNSTPAEALETWADGTQGSLASPSIDWFKYVMPESELNDIPEVHAWLQHTHERIRGILRDSNFYPSLSPVFRDAGSLGTACLLLEDIDDKLVCSTFHPREVFIQEGPYGQVDLFMREFWLAATNAAEQFGKDNLSSVIQTALINQPLKRYRFLHMICKSDNPLFENIPKVPNRPWVSVYVDANATTATEQKPLRMGGYFSKPFACWRLIKPSDSIYGHGLGKSALVDIKALNSISETLLRQAQMEVDPPLMITSTLRNKVRYYPRGRTYRQKADETVEPLWQGRNFNIGLEIRDRLQDSIKMHFNVDFFMQLAQIQKPLTAYEVAQRQGERAILMGPKIGRLQSDFFNPVHDRVFEMALSKGWVDPPPEILLMASSGVVDVQYQGPLAQAQERLFQTHSTERVLAMSAPILQIYPEGIDNFALDQTLQRIARDNDWPEGEIRDDRARGAIRQMRAQAQQQAAAAEMAERAAKQVPNLSKAPEEGSVVDTLIRSG